ncbi:MAG: hypothetical protein OEZ06_15035 [Myxococcales bacterium]|nr:hypothetical protein [Myxococcales bacterium]
MPALDTANRQIVLRIVYDGPGFAGKTTNLRQLTKFFSLLKRSELSTPEEADGRTRYFDWMHIDGGLVAGHGLRCQFVTVPGQNYLAHRRQAVLLTADIVVFVAESTPVGATAAQPLIEHMEQWFEDQHTELPPLLLQANKQDLPAAISADELALKLGLDADTPRVGAQATQGLGVRETAVLAIRAAAQGVAAQITRHGLENLPRRVQSQNDLLVSMMDDMDTLAPPPPGDEADGAEVVGVEFEVPSGRPPPVP